MGGEARHAAVFRGPLDQRQVEPVGGHQRAKALGMKTAWAKVPGLTVTEVDSGCCGMAGSFGYEKQHYDLSQKIGERRLFPAIRSMPEGTTMVACGVSCRHQVADATGVKALHWVETLRGTGATA